MVYQAQRWPARAGVAISVLLLSTILGGCSTAPTGRSVVDLDARHAGSSGVRQQLLHVARRAIGTPYRYGGSSPRGFDCSGLVQFAHREVGLDVPRTTASQWRHARTPDRRHLLPGDLVFFTLGGRKNRHVGIYEGQGRFIHAPSSGKRVRRASLNNPFWQDRLIGKKTFL